MDANTSRTERSWTDGITKSSKDILTKVEFGDLPSSVANATPFEQVTALMGAYRNGPTKGNPSYLLAVGNLVHSEFIAPSIPSADSRYRVPDGAEALER